jgi:hypothetical protein
VHVSQEPSETQGQSSDQDDTLDVGDDQLPEDLRPSEDNPLAQPADDDVPDDLLTQGGGHADSGEGSEDASRTGDGGASGAPSSEASSETASEGASDDEPDSDEPTD